MARKTYNDLVAEVRAQIAVDPDTAYAWLLDRSRVLNAEASWYLLAGEATFTDDERYYDLPADVVWVESVVCNALPYNRSTLHAMSARWSGQTGNTAPIYATAPGDPRGGQLQLHPPPSRPPIVVDYVAEIPDDRATVPVFPSDFDSVLVDGAIAIGLARMDERFDSANYFDGRFSTGVQRLRRRRHGQIGRGAVPIRVAL